MQHYSQITSEPGRLLGLLQKAAALAASLCLLTAASACTMRTRAPETLAQDEAPAAGSAGNSARTADAPAAAPSTDDARPAANGGASAAPAMATGSAAPAANGGSTDADAGAPEGGSGASASSHSTGGQLSAAAGSGGSAHSGAGSTASGAAQPQAADAGTPTTASTTAQLDKCDADLAQCIIDSPLNYDGCLRANADHGCPAPDAGTPPSSVLDENGNPISQVCQAELAKCIMNMPTPENALACTEKAMKCK